MPKHMVPSRVPQQGPIVSHEHKYVAPAPLAEVAWHLARVHAHPDPEYPVGRIRSVYFDSPSLAAYGEKAHGDHLKRKIRLRWYAESATGSNDTQAFLEIKHRLGSGRNKDRFRFAADLDWLESAPLTDPGWNRLLRRWAPEHPGWVPDHLVPVVCIAYRRHRFRSVEGLARICVDTEIGADRRHPDVLGDGPPVSLPWTVCEIKDHGATDLRLARDLFRAGFTRSSFSKYGLCLDHLHASSTPR